MSTCPACGRPKLLDAFSGEGGAGVGYMRAGFCVDAVDNAQARLDRYTLGCSGALRINRDAIEHIVASVGLYAAYHASPPCTGYSRGTVAIPDRLTRYDRLIAATRAALEATGRVWVIENVEDARSELRNPLTLCWTHFYRPGSVVDDDGTPLWMRRHRLFESNVDLWPADECDHPRDMQCAGAYGGARRDKEEARNVRHGGYVPSLDVMRRLLGTPWMSEKGCQLSIPPAYAEHIGGQLAAHLAEVAA